jgi:hypothetical protein
MRKIKCTEGNFRGQIGYKDIPLQEKNITDFIKSSHRETLYLTENRNISANGSGSENIGLKTETLITPSYSNLFEIVGAKLITSQVDAMNIRVPVYEGSTFWWLNENADMPEGSGTFTETTLKPYRLGTKLLISKEFFIQSTNDVQESITKELIDGVWTFFSQTIFGDPAATTISPQGCFYNTSNTIANYNDFLQFENDFLERNIIPTHYLTNPAGYVKLKSLNKIDNVVGDFVSYKSVGGVPLIINYNVGGAGSQTPYIMLANFNDLYVVEYGKIGVFLNPFTWGYNGVQEATINAYLNAAWGRNSYTTALLV